MANTANMKNKKRDYKRNYIVLPASILVFGLTPYAKLVFEYGITRPPEWHFSINGTAKDLNISSKAITKALSELKKAGLYHIEQVKNAQGRFEPLIHSFIDDPL